MPPDPPGADAPLVVFVSCPVADAATLARSIVEARLAACVQQLGPIRSVYRWRGAIEEADEMQLQIKTTAARYAALQAHICQHHPYEVPEVLALPVAAGLPAYLQWLQDETR